MTTLEKIRAEIEETQKNTIDWSRSAGLIDSLDIIDKYAEQEPCDKCKYFDGNSCQHYDYKVGYTQGYEDASKRFRQEPMREFTEEEAKAYSKAIDKMYKPTGFNVFDEPCDDVVSRQAVLDVIYGQHIGGKEAVEHGLRNTYAGDLREIADEIIALPSVRPQEQTGHWINTNSKSFEFHRVYKCSECGTTEIEYPESIHRHFRYCPNCGACMKDGRTLDEFIEDSKESEDDG